MSSWKGFIWLTIACLFIQAFFTMVEMACVSFNKVRLEYYVSRGEKRAIWLSRLISRPTLLFGATMLGVNTAMLLGSECARRFYHALGVSPDWAALTQTFLVVVFAEISPMFAGRRFAEHAAIMGVPVLYAFSVIVRPIIWFFHLLCVLVNWLIKTPKNIELFLSREELQKAIEERDDSVAVGIEPKEFDTIVANIFALKTKTASELMLPLSSVPIVSSACTVGEMQDLLSSEQVSFLPIYNRNPANIVAIAYPRDFIRAKKQTRIRELARPVWFIVQTTSVIDILKQFRRNNQIVAVVLDHSGQTVGLLTLDEIIDEIFGESDAWLSLDDAHHLPSQVMIDRSFPGETSLAELKADYQIELFCEGANTLEELCEKLLGHTPTKGDSLRFEEYQLTVEEAPLIGSLVISIKSIS
jgi:putative hemolysin